MRLNVEGLAWKAVLHNATTSFAVSHAAVATELTLCIEQFIDLRPQHVEILNERWLESQF